MAKKTPVIKWGQDRESIFLTVEFPEHSKGIAPADCSCTTSDDGMSLEIETPIYALRLPLQYQVAKELKHFLLDEDAKSARIHMSKEDGTKPWKSLISNTAPPSLKSFLKVDWTHWLDTEDFDVLFETPNDMIPMAVSPADEKLPTCEIPNLAVPENWTLSTPAQIPSSDDDSPAEFVAYFSDKLTPAQRMLTLLHLWNGATVDERVECLQFFNKADKNSRLGKLMEKVKGGEEVLSDLVSKPYDAHNVQYVQPWVTAFTTMETAHKLYVLQKLISSLNQAEVEIVFSTFY